MQAHGFTTASPAELEQSFQQSYPRKPSKVGGGPIGNFKSAEITAAVADAECQRSTGFRSTLNALLGQQAARLDSEASSQARQVIDSLRRAAHMAAKDR